MSFHYINKITPLPSLNVLTLNLILTEKIVNYYWTNRNKKKILLYPLLGDKIMERSLYTYTSFGSYCLAIICLYEMITQKRVSSHILHCCWSILFSVTAGYYIYVIPFIINQPGPTNWILNIWCHGPYLLITSLKIKNRFPEMKNPLIYKELNNCLLYSYCWLFLIWLPWYCKTGDYMYPPLSDRLSLKKRIGNIFKMSLLLSLGVSSKYLLITMMSRNKLARSRI